MEDTQGDANITRDPALAKFELVERVKEAYLEELGSVVKVARRLKLDLRLTYRLVEKFRRKDDLETKKIIGERLSNFILNSIESTVMQLNKMVRSLDSQEQPYVSSCCESAFEPYPVDDTLYAGRTKCIKCNLPCNKLKVNRIAIMRLKADLLRQMSEEKWRVVELTDKMDYRTNPPPDMDPKKMRPIKVEQTVFNVGTVGPGGAIENKVYDYEAMTPMDRDRLIERLERQVMRLDREDKEEKEAEERKKAMQAEAVDVTPQPQPPEPEGPVPVPEEPLPSPEQPLNPGEGQT